MGFGAGVAVPSVTGTSNGSGTGEMNAAVARAVQRAERRSAGQQARTENHAVDELESAGRELESARSEAKVELLAAIRAAKVRQRRVVARAVAAERRRADARVAAAKSSAENLAVGSSEPEVESGTDPRFDWCYEANDAGYGPYYQGSDPEYDWYDDADRDGVVCEY